MSRLYFGIHDSDKSFPIVSFSTQEAMAEFNADGYGVFWSVNLFSTERQLERLERLYAFYVDLDAKGETKQDQLTRLKSNLWPSMIVETKNGFHAYWRCKPSVNDPERYLECIKRRLIPAFRADRVASDIMRLLRVPGFYHMKDPNNPFLVELLENNRREFSFEDIESAFPKVESLTKQVLTKTNKRNVEVLQKLSGTAAVNFEILDFVQTTSGNLNLLVNKKSTHIFIPQDEDIICARPGPQSAFDYVDWHWKDKDRTLKEIQKIIPDFKIEEGL